jgi:hypothetical protein
VSTSAILGRVAESLVLRFGDHEFDEEVSSARDHYCERRGRVFEDDDDWERFTRGFLEWYVVERPWRDTGLSPAALVAAETEEGEDRSALEALANSQRSLVEICDLRKSGLEVIDLVGGARFEVSEERRLTGMQTGDVVELRLFGYQERVSLGQTFWFHPDGTGPAIRDKVRSMREEGARRGDIIDHIALLRSRSRSYQHVSPVRIYESGGPVAGEPS